MSQKYTSEQDALNNIYIRFLGSKQTMNEFKFVHYRDNFLTELCRSFIIKEEKERNTYSFGQRFLDLYGVYQNAVQPDQNLNISFIEWVIKTAYYLKPTETEDVKLKEKEEDIDLIKSILENFKASGKSAKTYTFQSFDDRTEDRYERLALRDFIRKAGSYYMFTESSVKMLNHFNDTVEDLVKKVDSNWNKVNDLLREGVPAKESTKSNIKQTQYLSQVSFSLNKGDKLTPLREVTAFNLVETKDKKTLTITSLIPKDGIEFNPNVGDQVQLGIELETLAIVIEASCTEKKISKSANKEGYQLLTFDVLELKCIDRNEELKKALQEEKDAKTPTLALFVGGQNFYVGQFELQLVEKDVKNPQGYACETSYPIIKFTALKDDFNTEELEKVMQYGITVLFENKEHKHAVVKEILSPTSFTLQWKD